MNENSRKQLAAQASKLGIDLDDLLVLHESINADLITKYRELVPRAEGGVAEFRFTAVGNTKRRLLRRNLGTIQKSRGAVSCRNAMPFDWLTYYSAFYELTAQETGANLVSWRIAVSPNSG